MLWQMNNERFAPYFARSAPWEVLDDLPAILAEVGRSCGYRQIALQVWAHPTAQVDATALVRGPCVLDEGAVVKAYAYVRECVYVGRYAVVGHAVELKNAVLMAHAQAAHFNYVGDSVLGAYAHLGAGAVLSNLRQDKAYVSVQIEEVRYLTNRRKMGALVGDSAEVGCNAVLNPGTVLAKGAAVRPSMSVKGYIAAK